MGPSKRAYHLFGIRLETDVPFAELSLPLRVPSNPTPRVLFRKRNFRLRTPPTRWLRYGGLSYGEIRNHRLGLLRSPLVGDFRLDFIKKTIDWKPSPRGSLKLAQAIATGRALGLILSHLKPLLLLHASVLVIRGAAIVFLGPSGGGKSTLAASFLNQGHSLLSDDVAVIKKRGGRFLLLPGSPTVRLWPRSERRLNVGNLKSDRVYPETKKKLLCLEGQTRWRFTKKTVPLKSLYVLQRKKRGGLRIDLLSKKEALVNLWGHHYNTVTETPSVLRRQFRMAMEMIEKISVKRLIYPTGFRHLSKIRRALLRDLEPK